jgi:cellobionic acid phosphorylase
MDGKWFRRGFKADGTVFGSEKNKEGKIYLNPQSWAVISGAATKTRLKLLWTASNNTWQLNMELLFAIRVYL